jgi:uncharacterized protein (TIGR03435 family)
MRTSRSLSLAAAAAMLFGSLAAFGQAANKPAFDVASVKPSALDMQALTSQVMAGKMPKVGKNISGTRVEYTFMSLKELIAEAYKVKAHQITGPDWLAAQRFDIAAKMPEGSGKDDAPVMLQALLEERFKLVVRHETKEQSIMALLVGKGGPKLKDAPPESAEPANPDAPLKAGEMKMDTPEGQVRVAANKNGGATIDMGKRGTTSFKMDPATNSMHLEASSVAMGEFADMLTSVSKIGGGEGRTVVDMTGLKGKYQVALDIPLADLIAMARATMPDLPIPANQGAAAAGPASAASDPSGPSSMMQSIQALGLKLEKQKAPVEQLIIEHAEKSPTEN